VEEDVAAELTAVGSCEWHVVISCVIFWVAGVSRTLLAGGDRVVDCRQQCLMEKGFWIGKMLQGVCWLE
jgi:hypothetical protein